MNGSSPPAAQGLAKIEKILFVFGVLAFAFIMLAFGSELAGESYLPVVGVWVVLGLGFVWWFDRRLRRSELKKIKKLNRRRAHR